MSENTPPVYTLADAARALAILEDVHRAATPEPWFIGYDGDVPSALCRATARHPDGSLNLEPIMVSADAWSPAEDLTVAEYARNALPLLVRVARALLELQTLKDIRPADYDERKPQAWAEALAALVDLGLLLPSKGGE